MRVSDTVPREAAPVFVLKRLRFAGSKPMGIQTAYVPLELVKGLEHENVENVAELLEVPAGASVFFRGAGDLPAGWKALRACAKQHAGRPLQRRGRTGVRPSPADPPPLSICFN